MSDDADKSGPAPASDEAHPDQTPGADSSSEATKEAGQAPQQERRRCRRFYIKDCIIQHKRSGLLSVLRSYSQEGAPLVNISLSGIQFFTNARYTVDTRIRMLVHIPGEDEPLRLKGAIVWEGTSANSYTSRIGVVFTRTSEDTWRRLHVLERSYCRDLPLDEAIPS